MKSTKRHVNIPIFIPHIGCPNDCVFCNQRRISGVSSFAKEDCGPLIERYLATSDPSSECEIAFFGGSFTGIDPELMLYLLKTAYKYVEDGRVESIRLSTRPDYIDRERLDVLKKYGVKVIELGLQSCDEGVLKTAKRGHTFDDERNACRLIKEYGFTLVGQMMIALPSSTLEKELATARFIAENCDGARVYPTVVFRETELYDLFEQGLYTPPSLEENVARTGEVLDLFDSYGTKVIRVGLQSGDNLLDENSCVTSTYHPAIGEMASSYVFYKRIARLLGENGSAEGKALVVSVPKGRLSQAVGQKRMNCLKLKEKFSLKSVKAVENNGLLGYNVKIDII